MLYDFMFKRKSIRKYSEKPLENKTLKEIEEYSKTLTKLFPNIKTELKVIKSKDVKLVSSKAPYYIAFFSEDKKGYLTNAGFMLEQMDLFLSSNAIGSCWIGVGSPVKEIENKFDLKFVILLAFGNAEEKLYRENLSEFNRKSIEQVSNIDNELMQIVRLCPSAMNSQPWYFNQINNEIDVYICKNNIVKNLMLAKKNEIDIGIALCYMWLVSKNENTNIEFTTKYKKEIPKCEYVITAIIK